MAHTSVPDPVLHLPVEHAANRDWATRFKLVAQMARLRVARRRATKAGRARLVSPAPRRNSAAARVGDSSLWHGTPGPREAWHPYNMRTGICHWRSSDAHHSVLSNAERASLLTLHDARDKLSDNTRSTTLTWPSSASIAVQRTSWAFPSSFVTYGSPALFLASIRCRSRLCCASLQHNLQCQVDKL